MNARTFTRGLTYLIYFKPPYTETVKGQKWTATDGGNPSHDAPNEPGHRNCDSALLPSAGRLIEHENTNSRM